MQRIINDPDLVVDDMIEGFVKTHPDIVARTSNPRVLKYINAPVKQKVAVVTGGGSGHKPAFIGYVGKNMLDAVAAGEIFSSPSARCFFASFFCIDSCCRTKRLVLLLCQSTCGIPLGSPLEYRLRIVEALQFPAFQQIAIFIDCTLYLRENETAVLFVVPRNAPRVVVVEDGDSM